jgi:hypothetical protein
MRKKSAILIAQIKTDSENISRNQESGLYRGFAGTKVFIRESKRIIKKLDAFVESLESRKDSPNGECSEGYPIGGQVEPYDIEREKDSLK